MQKWEYNWQPLAEFTIDYREHLNALGEEGWEFAGLFPPSSGPSKQPLPMYFVLFKRPKA